MTRRARGRPRALRAPAPTHPPGSALSAPTSHARRYGTSLTVVIFGTFHPQIGRRGQWNPYRVAYLAAFVGAPLRAARAEPRRARASWARW